MNRALSSTDTTCLVLGQRTVMRGKTTISIHAIPDDSISTSVFDFLKYDFVLAAPVKFVMCKIKVDTKYSGHWDRASDSITPSTHLSKVKSGTQIFKT